VCELVRGGDVATAQGMLDAAGITLPTGNLVDGCYDEVGNLYRLPELVVSDPANIRRDGDGRGGEGEEGEPDPEEADEVRVDDRSRNSNNIDGETMIGVSEPKVVGAAAEKVVDGEEKDVEKESEEILGRRREEKGKGSERDAVKVRCRLSDRGGPDVVIAMGKTQHVGTLARRVQSEGDVSRLFHPIPSPPPPPTTTI
jgi:Ubiquitin-binding domain